VFDELRIERVNRNIPKIGDKKVLVDIKGMEAGEMLKLGLVTYNLAKDWDVPTIIERCTKTGFEAVELRTTHAHGVEPSLNERQRKEVRKMFEGSAVRLLSLGTACEYHSVEKGVSVEETLRQIGSALRECGTFAEDYGVEIWLEVHDKGTSDLRYIKRIMDIADHKNVGVCWNSNNTDVIGG